MSRQDSVGFEPKQVQQCRIKWDPRSGACPWACKAVNRSLLFPTVIVPWSPPAASPARLIRQHYDLSVNSTHA